MTLEEMNCPADEMTRLIALVGDREEEARQLLDELLLTYPDDAQLHFLDGSLRAAARDYAGARTAMARAVELAPDYALARFQLGLLLLSSGEPDPAQRVWAPLHQLPPGDPLRLFAEGLGHLIRDQFDDAVELLERGIALNRDNAPLNHDMAMMIREIRSLNDSGDRGTEETGTMASAAQMLLQQAALKSTKH